MSDFSLKTVVFQKINTPPNLTGLKSAQIVNGFPLFQPVCVTEQKTVPFFPMGNRQVSASICIIRLQSATSSKNVLKSAIVRFFAARCFLGITGKSDLKFPLS